MTKEMNKYPYIGEPTFAPGSYALFTSNNTGCKLADRRGVWSDIKLGEFDSGWDESSFNDITREYLENTKIKIESPVHSEYVQEMAIRYGFNWGGIESVKYTNASYLYFRADNLISQGYNDCDFIAHPKKEITLPLPPKSPPVSTVNRDIEREAWPKIGDDFIHKGELVTCISKGATSDGSEVLTFEFKGRMKHGSCWNDEAWVQKPKSETEILRDEIAVMFCNKYNFITGEESLQITESLLSKYNITKKPQ